MFRTENFNAATTLPSQPTHVLLPQETSRAPAGYSKTVSNGRVVVKITQPKHARHQCTHLYVYRLDIATQATLVTAIAKIGAHVGNTHLHIYRLGISTPGTQGMANDIIDSSMQTTPTFVHFIVWPSTGKGARCSHYLVSHYLLKYAESADAQPRPWARPRPSRRWAPNASWGKREAPVATVEDRK